MFQSNVGVTGRHYYGWLVAPIIPPTETTCTYPEINLSIPYHHQVDLIGSPCDESGGLTYSQDPDTFRMNVTIDQNVCTIDDSVELSVGRSNGHLLFAVLDIGIVCEVRQFSVTMNYGQVSGDDVDTESDGAGLFRFDIALYDEAYNNTLCQGNNATDACSFAGGEIVHIGLTATEDFDTTNYYYVPRYCTYGVSYAADETGPMVSPYGIFNSVDEDCSNEDIQFQIQYDSDAEMWKMSHVVFMLVDEDVNYEMTCFIDVCSTFDGGEHCVTAGQQCDASFAT